MAFIQCWNVPRECDAFEEIAGDDYDALFDIAGAKGWAIGHFDGQSHYACERCAVSLYDPQILRGLGPMTEAS